VIRTSKSHLEVASLVQPLQTPLGLEEEKEEAEEEKEEQFIWMRARIVTHVTSRLKHVSSPD